MQLEFLNRENERKRLEQFRRRREGALAVIYGRRRCGKSRLLRETLPASHTVYYVGDERDAPLQRSALAMEIGRHLQGFDRVQYPDWDALFSRWWREADSGQILVLDEFPALVSMAPELPSILQKHLDNERRKCHLVLCGSSQRMMQGLVLDRSAPLFGRAVEVLRIGPLGAKWIRAALDCRSDVDCIERYAIWGGVPRYWELAADHSDPVRDLALDPLGVLHLEPGTLLMDDIQDPAHASSILQLIGHGCHRISEIAGRLGKPATSLSRPLQRLVELGYVRRDHPALTVDSKRSLYRINDPFLRFWFRFVGPNRSLLEARRIDMVASLVARDFNHFVASVWEDMARDSVPRIRLHGVDWKPASAWWGGGLDRTPLEIDVVAESVDGTALLVGSVKWEEKTDVRRVAAELVSKAALLPIVGTRRVLHALWVKRTRSRAGEVQIVQPQAVLESLQ